jgi:hypothetical protein
MMGAFRYFKIPEDSSMTDVVLAGVLSVSEIIRLQDKDSASK